MKAFFKKFETAAMAAAFAEEGEFTTARELMKEEERILVAVAEGKVDEKTIRYAAQTCTRIGAGLDILYVAARTSPEPALEQQLARLGAERISFRVITRTGYIKKEIIDYTNEHNGILFAITDSADHGEAESRGARHRLADAWQDLKCPLVVVADSLHSPCR